MEVGPPVTACRGSHQTALSCMCKRAYVVSVREKGLPKRRSSVGKGDERE